jgi:hypothetical protein
MTENLITKNNIDELIKFKNEIEKYSTSKEKSFDLNELKKTSSSNNKPIDVIKTINKLKNEVNVDIDDELEGVVYDKRQLMQDKFINLNKKEKQMSEYYKDLLEKQKLTNSALEFQLEQLLKHRKDMTMEIRYDDFDDY